jgi:hypothetical protein
MVRPHWTSQGPLVARVYSMLRIALCNYRQSIEKDRIVMAVFLAVCISYQLIMGAEKKQVDD